jgi:4-hydroxy 2-oxovalerate aldolase
LRDGGYVNNWEFSESQIMSTLLNLTNARIDYVEIGYLTSILGQINGAKFLNIERASKVLPQKRGNTKYVIMVDVSDFDADSLCPRSNYTLDGIRVVFYKRQIEYVHSVCKKICEQGYDLFLQPMVTVDYSTQEFTEHVNRFCKSYRIYAIAIVDSFGCMNTEELHNFVKILDNNIDEKIKIGFHGHDNMLLSQINAVSLFNQNKREFIIDCSVSGMGRGAGNLCTELIANYHNGLHGSNYDLDFIMNVASEVTEPLSRKYRWGYSPYFMLTAMRRAHPNFATYLLDTHNVSVSEFADFIRYVPNNMLTKCTRQYVEELYNHYIKGVE